ncbi:MAG: DUF2303 family protein [Rhodospirillaceae bacterium]
MDGLDKIIEAGQALADAKSVPGGTIPYAVVPVGAHIEELERLLPAPARARAAVTAKSAATFNAYVVAFKTSATAIFADQEEFTLVGVIDYHLPETPAWGSHRVTYAAPRSLEWQTWRGSSGKKMAQADFARFIEDNVVDIRSPAGADVLEVARGLQAQKSVQFVSAIRLSDGAQEFTYSEAVAGSTSKGKIKVPEEFKLGIPVFLGGDAYEVTARLRYRINDGQLLLWYEIYRPEYIERDAFETVCDAANKATAIAVWQGSPS